MQKQANTLFPGFDSLRLLGALSVLFSHSYLITQDTDASEPLQQLLKGEKNIAGLYGVFTFFIVSGFLLARSLHRNPSPLRFTINRSLRLFPGFGICVLFCALVVGPLSTSLPLQEYVLSAGWIRYIQESLTQIADAPLPGVFNYTSSIAQVVNGSLWSLRAELICYVILLCCWLVLPAAGWVAALFAALGGTILMVPSVLNSLPEVAYPWPYFAAGVVMWWLTHHLGDSRTLAFFSIAGMGASLLLGFPHQAFACFGAYLVVYVGCRPTPLSTWIEQVGDLSYGLYLFGWPVQQMLRQFLDLRLPLVMFVASTIITGCLAWLLFHTVEQPAMALRQPLVAWLSRSRSSRTG